MVRIQDWLVGEASSTLPLEEEEPQRASYAAAGRAGKKGYQYLMVRQAQS